MGGFEGSAESAGVFESAFLCYVLDAAGCGA